MDRSAVAAFLAPLAAVLLGGALSLAGGWFQHSWRQEASKSQKRKEKFEELMLALFEHEHWLNTVYQVRMRGRELALPANPIAKVSAIASAHFPNFQFDVLRLKSAADSYERWLLDFAEQRLHKKPHSPLSFDGHAQAHEFYIKAFRDLVTKLGNYADKELP